MPKIFKMPKPSPTAEKNNDHRTHDPASVSKTTPLAEIILFPNGRNEVPFAPGLPDDPETKTRWLHLADDALDVRRKRKKA